MCENVSSRALRIRNFIDSSCLRYVFFNAHSIAKLGAVKVPCVVVIYI